MSQTPSTFYAGSLLMQSTQRRVSAVLSQYVSKGLQLWGIKTDSDIEKKYVYLEWKVFVNIRKKHRPDDQSLKYAESEFTKHNHLLSLSLGNRPRSIPSMCFIVGFPLSPYLPASRTSLPNSIYERYLCIFNRRLQEHSCTVTFAC